MRFIMGGCNGNATSDRLAADVMDRKTNPCTSTWRLLLQTIQNEHESVISQGVSGVQLTSMYFILTTTSITRTVASHVSHVQRSSC